MLLGRVALPHLSSPYKGEEPTGPAVFCGRLRILSTNLQSRFPLSPSWERAGVRGQKQKTLDPRLKMSRMTEGEEPIYGLAERNPTGGPEN